MGITPISLWNGLVIYPLCIIVSVLNTSIHILGINTYARLAFPQIYCASYCVRFARNTVARVTDVVKQFDSTSTIHDIQLWLEEILSTTFHHQIVYAHSQLHFLDSQPILALTNICHLVTGNETIAIQVLSKSPLITTDDSDVTYFLRSIYYSAVHRQFPWAGATPTHQSAGANPTHQSAGATSVPRPASSLCRA